MRTLRNTLVMFALSLLIGLLAAGCAAVIATGFYLAGGHENPLFYILARALVAGGFAFAATFIIAFCAETIP